MKFCDKCGSELPEGTSFCPGCGQSISQTPPQNQEQTNQNVEGPTPINPNQGFDSTTDKGAAVIAYFGFLAVISLYAMKPQTQFGQFHAKQGLNLFILQLIVNVGVSVINFGLAALEIPALGSILSLAGYALSILSFVGLIWAAQGKMEELPVVGKIKFVK